MSIDQTRDAKEFSTEQINYGFFGASQILKNKHGRGFAEAENAKVPTSSAAWWFAS